MDNTLIRVLLVEDNPADVVMLREALARDPLSSFQLVLAERLSQGLGRLQEQRVDAMLLDLGLPDSQGLATFEAVNRQAPEVPVVVLSGLLDEQVAVQAVQAGAQDYLVKGPSGWDIVARAIRYAIERQQARATLRAREQHFRALIEQSADAIALLTADCTILYESQAATRILGFRQEELVGHSISEFLHPDDHTFCDELFGQVLQQPRTPIITQFRLRHTDGTWRWVEATATDLLDEPSVHAIVMNYRDITARKQAEEALRQRNRDLDLLNRLGHELSSTLDLAQVLERLLQASSEMVGAAGGSVWLWDEEQPGRLICRISTCPGPKRSPVGLGLDAGQGVAGWVAQVGTSALSPFVKADPRFSPNVDEQTGFHTVSLIAVPLRVRDRVIGVLETVNKHSGQFGDDDLALLETLGVAAATAVDNARLVDTLRQSTVELQARNQELDTFAHTVAHDLKTPLSLIIGHAELSDQDSEASLEDLRRTLQLVVRNGRKVSSIVDELLLLSEVRSVQVALQPLDMASIVAEAQERLALAIQECQAQIIAPDRWPVAWGYAPWVEGVWTNYMSNALKYGGTPPRVELGATPLSEGGVRFWVRDNGSGLSPEDRARLFMPFARLGQARAKGHGLGLSIVRRIVDKLGGQVGVESQVGQGSTFSFTLPGAPG
jgi:PAS domain S-box-containing protein